MTKIVRCHPTPREGEGTESNILERLKNMYLVCARNSTPEAQRAGEGSAAEIPLREGWLPLSEGAQSLGREIPGPSSTPPRATLLQGPVRRAVMA